MNAPLRDLGPLAWVMNELKRTLDETTQAVSQFVRDNELSRQTDLSEVDSTALRMARQQLHQAAGALDMVDLSAATTTLRALEAAIQRLIQKPALATAATRQTIQSGAHALIEYLDRMLRGRPVSELALFPTYRDWQQLAGASRAHPADLWVQAHADADLPAGKVYEPGPAVRAHLERLVLHVVKALSPQAALPLAQLTGGLARAAQDAAIRRFWLAAAAYFEAVGAGRLPDAVYVKRAASSVLLQYAQLLHGDTQGLAGHTHDLLYLASRVAPDAEAPSQAHLRAVWAAHGWTVQTPWDPEQRQLGAYDPAVLEALRATVHVVQQAWSVSTEKQGSATSTVAAALDPLADCLQQLLPGFAPMADLAASWAAVAAVCRQQPSLPEGLALEASNSLLLLGAELDDFDPLDVATAERLSALNQRLTQALQGEPVPPPEPWMTERYQRVGEQSTLVQVVAQWRSELDAVELQLDAVFRQQSLAPLPSMDALDRRLDTLGGIATLLDLPEARRTLEAIRQTLQALMAASPTVDAAQLTAAAAVLGPNVTALGWMLDTFARQPDLARSAYRFDESRGALVAETSAQVPEHESEPRLLEVAQDDQDDDGAELLSIFMDEAQGVFDSAEATLAVLRQRPDSLADLTALRRGFHTLKGSARMVGLADVGEAAWAMEQLLNTCLAEQAAAHPALLDQSVAALADLKQRVDRLREGQPQAPVPPAPEPPLLDDVVARPDDTPDIPVLDEAVKVIGSLQVDLDLYNVFLNEADEWSRRLCQGLTEWALDGAEPLPPALSAWAHSLAGGAATVGYTGLSQLARALEHALDRAASVAPSPAITPAQAALWVQAAEEARHLLHQFAAGFLREPSHETQAALEAMAFDAASPAAAPEPAATPANEVVDPLPLSEPVDRLDVDLFAVFEDESHEILPRLSAALRQWQARPDNTGARAEVLRNLHTLKGSARLAGAMRLGDMVHAFESDILALPEPVDALAVAPLQASLDAIVNRFEALRRSYALQAAGRLPVESIAQGVQMQAPEGLPPPVAPVLPEPAPASTGSVRVRADLLDQLMAQTGDVMIARARLENDMRALRQSFKDMSSNIERLRSQLRDLELQTEMQMQSRLAQSRETDARFDPLEFDRYTRVQELTRLLAESVNDVATVQHHLQRSVESAEGNLAAQSRQTRELQRDLLRTRLVAFDTLGERLHRVVRQAADASGKQVQLTMAQQDIEVDRAVLERLTPVLEHLLRNAVVHGIEPPGQRLMLGKPEAGTVHIALSAQGNDLSLTVSDDGAGLPVERIRQRALALHLHPAHTPFTEDDAVRAIFASGLTTADEVSEVAGRGIGLDVVRNEVLGLGGRVEYLRPDRGGTAFRLVVPLSTAVTQVVMLRVGDFVLGVPAPWVETVHRAQAPALTAAYLSGEWREGPEPMPFHWAGALLALSPESTDPMAHEARNWPVIEFCTAGQRVAWHVDEVLGHQDVVVKPMGPQLARLPGLAGATVLASGAVALIYNPVALTTLYGEAARRWARQQRSEAPAARPAAADAGAAPQAPLVLVVDDSITVRRVTQRLLKREGYRVALAADGVQALERIAEELPVVALCDIEMPRMDGFELVERLRSETATANLPVVMITSRLADKHRDHARSLGVDHYLGKPYAEDELLALVQAYARLAPQVFLTTA